MFVEGRKSLLKIYRNYIKPLRRKKGEIVNTVTMHTYNMEN